MGLSRDELRRLHLDEQARAAQAKHARKLELQAVKHRERHRDKQARALEREAKRQRKLARQ